jgi:PAS domain S-box-containing protein
MAKQVDHSNLIDQLEELKQGLSKILSQQEGSRENGYIPQSGDQALLENYQILNASDKLNNGNQSFILLDRRHQVLAYNRHGASVIHSLTGHELGYQTSIEEYLPEGDKEQLKELIDQAFSGINLHFTSQIPFTNDPHQWYEINLFPVATSGNQITRLVWSMEDIAARKSAQANLKALEINFQSVFKQAAVGVILSNTNLEVIQANHKFYQLIEYEPKEFKALPPLSTVHPRDLDESKRLLNLLCNGELNSFSLEKRLISKNGKIIWVYVTTNMVKDSSGKPKLIITVAQDITDRKHAEQELLFKSNELDTFIYRASHDLRGPVASLLGLYNVVQNEFKDEPHALEYFQHYHRSVLHLNKILHNLIDLTKIKDKEIHPTEVDLNVLISDCLASISKTEHFEKIHFKIKNELDFKLQTDSSSIRTILFHLLENAVKFIQKDNPQPFVKLEIKHESNFLIIEVTDNGLGIKKELQSEVFNMFYRANERSTGSGLGLYIVRYAVEKLNGSIQLKSKEYSGTKISVYIPYAHSDTLSSNDTDTESRAVG